MLLPIGGTWAQQMAYAEQLSYHCTLHVVPDLPHPPRALKMRLAWMYLVRRCGQLADTRGLSGATSCEQVSTHLLLAYQYRLTVRTLGELPQTSR